MIEALVSHAFVLFLHIAAPVVAAVVGGAACASLLQVVTRIEDGSISLVGRLTGAALVLIFFSRAFGNEVLQFALSVWGGSETYFQ